MLEGQVITDYDGQGARKNSYVYAGGELIYEQLNGQSLWYVTNPVTGDARDTDSTGKLVNDTHLDPEGVNTGAIDPANYNGEPQPDPLPHAGAYAAYLPHSLGGSGRCRLESFDVGCGFIASLEATGLVKPGSASPAVLPVYSRSERRYVGFAWLDSARGQYLFNFSPGRPSLKNVTPEEAARRKAYVAEFGRSGFGDEGVALTSFSDPQKASSDPLISNQDVLRELYCLWQRGGNGVADSERSIWITSIGGNYNFVPWPWSAVSKLETWRGRFPVGTIANAHTHADRLLNRRPDSPMPSRSGGVTGRGDQGTADTINLPVYVVTGQAIWKAVPRSQPVQVAKNEWWKSFEKAKVKCH